MPPTMRPAGTPSSGGWMRHLDSRYGTNPAIVPGATKKNTNDPSTAPTVLVTPLLPHHAFVFAERRASGACRPLLGEVDGPATGSAAETAGSCHSGSWGVGRQTRPRGDTRVPTEWPAHADATPPQGRLKACTPP